MRALLVSPLPPLLLLALWPGCGGAPATATSGKDTVTSETGTATADTVAADNSVSAADGADTSAAVEDSASDTGPAVPNPQWTALNDAPRILWGTMLAPAPGQSRMFVAFGGNSYPNNAAVNNRTWVYAAGDDQWSEQQLPGAPPPRYCHCLVALPDHGQVLLVGGRNATGGLQAAAWTYDVTATTWQPIDPPVPQGTIGCHAGWLPHVQGGRAVVFGGQGLSVGMDATTWLYDPAARKFSKHETSVAPSPRRDGATVSDLAGKRVLLFGGQTQPIPSADHIDDTWQFDGEKWTQIAKGQTAPAKRRYPGVAFDQKRRWMVVFSGTNEWNDYEDLWLFDASKDTWQQLPLVDGPDVRSFGAMAWDAADGSFVFFGGFTSPGMKGLADGWRLRL